MDSSASPTDVQNEDEKLFLEWDDKLDHLPAKPLLKLLKVGKISKRISRVYKQKRLPVCSSCIFGQAHRKPWRTKGGGSSNTRRPTNNELGEGVSTDQLVSAQPGLILQSSGKLTRSRIWAATIFMDHFTYFLYVHLMIDSTLESTLEPNVAYESLCDINGVQIKCYHSDNRRVKDPAFKTAVSEEHQRITFCGVGPHHQNGRAERYIKELTCITCTILLHAKRH